MTVLVITGTVLIVEVIGATVSHPVRGQQPRCPRAVRPSVTCAWRTRG